MDYYTTWIQVGFNLKNLSAGTGMSYFQLWDQFSQKSSTGECQKGRVPSAIGHNMTISKHVA
jgi:hypothetical protein